MRISRLFTERVRPARLRLAAAASMVVTVVLAGLPPAVAVAAETSGGTAAPAAEAPPSGASVEPLCQVPQPGRVGCFALRRNQPVSRQGVLSAAAPPDGYGAADLQSAYNLPADGGDGRTVAIVVANDDPTAEADLAVYRAQYGLPACTTANGCFRKIDQRGGTDYPEPEAGWAGEASLDMDMVSASAPAAHILLVEADSTLFEDMFAAVDQAVAQGAQYVSNSYGSDYRGAPGSGEDPAESTEFDTHFNRPGVVMVASSGDFGYGVSYPAASPYVTAVGGTTLTRSTTNSRGWTESAWYATGSGCSAYEPKPGFQTDTGCDGRSVVDVSAVADATPGVAIYQTYGGYGWATMAGTSVGAPLITGVYADAGAPAAGTYANSYPYFKPSALNDVTSGVTATCSPSYLCTAAAGYDGPTGLGTPNGLAAFRSYPNGTVSGTVTDSAGAPLTGATVSADGYQVTVNSRGHYSLTLPPGSYDLRASAYGYRTRTVQAVTVADHDAIAQDLSLDTAPSRTITGKVTDGSGHGYPLYASVTAQDVPGAPVFTNPYTGTYTLTLPEDHDYTLKVVAQYPGYQTVTKDVTVASSTGAVDVALPVDPEKDTVAGYDVGTVGRTEPFDATDSPPDGWSVVNAAGTTGGWAFSDLGHRLNTTGGSGGFAIADSYYFAAAGSRQDSSLVSPVYDFSGYTRPRISFDTNYFHTPGQSGAVDITTDGGATWTNLRAFTATQTGHIDIPIAAYDGAKTVQVRFRFIGSHSLWWELDNLFVGDHPVTPQSGGLVAGVVTDANTGAGVLDATVGNDDHPGQTGVTVATPSDPQLDDGFYWLFTDARGKQSFTVTKSKFASGTGTARVAPDGVTRIDRALEAGRITVESAAVDKTVAWDGTGTKKLTVRNTGTAPATFTVTEQLSNPDAGGTPVVGDAWQPVADLPTPIMDNVVAADGGRLYSASGFDGSSYTSSLYTYDAGSDTWSQLASAADARDSAAGGFIGGRFYVVGGHATDYEPDAKLEIYDPATDTWTTGAPSPKPYASSGSAVVDGRLFVVGGCTKTSCVNRDVYAYDPRTDKWSTMASYPEPISWTSCGEIADMLYCAGGLTDSGITKHSYAYDPVTDSWSRIADMPVALWGAGHTAANGRLLTIGGRTASGVTSRSFAYDPRTSTWTALPNAPTSIYRGGAAPGFYVVGGRRTPSDLQMPASTVDVLPGYDQGDRTDDVSWLGLQRQQATLRPGASTTVTVSLDATVSDVTQPGDYPAQLGVTTDTPYHVAPIPVTMTVKPPEGWGRYVGTVLGADGAGGVTPLAGATVQLVGKESSHTVTTGDDGTFSLWLDARGGPLDVTVSMDGYASQTTQVKLVKGRSTPGDFTLQEAP
ncbi:Kelch repeat-containing protein [Actinacidiphila rubida]|uniref:Kelch motif-containing protein n=1 Tax=Actinacidiphila rubida TaxID=310780 RepID=A0A1H8K7X4_9ACTN|nr:carboxypeptidase regulatory-like domain-containing protein [Actinacidiphila rubida]SEN88935.1 Kelch motif-containing protein [Actinacidiphila rubida]